MLRAEVHHICRIGRPTNFKLDKRTEYTKTRIKDKRHNPQNQRRRSHGPSDRCWPISRELEVPEIAKLVGTSS